MANDKGEGKERIFTSHFSKWIAGFYGATLIFLVVLIIFVPLFEAMQLVERMAFYSLFSAVILIMLYTVYKAANMKFVLTNEKIEISGLLRKKKIKLSSIEKVEKTPIPFGFRLFGASFLGGKYYLPGIGKANVAMTNFQDGVLIETRQGKNYVITPVEPFKFIDSIGARLEDKE